MAVVSAGLEVVSGGPQVPLTRDPIPGLSPRHNWSLLDKATPSSDLSATSLQCRDQVPESKGLYPGVSSHSPVVALEQVAVHG